MKQQRNNDQFHTLFFTDLKNSSQNETVWEQLVCVLSEIKFDEDLHVRACVCVCAHTLSYVQ